MTTQLYYSNTLLFNDQSHLQKQEKLFYWLTKFFIEFRRLSFNYSQCNIPLAKSDVFFNRIRYAKEDECNWKNNKKESNPKRRIYLA